MNKKNNERPNEQTALDVCMALKGNVMRSLNVAELGIIKEINESNYRCKLINSDIQIECNAIMNLELQVNDVVLIIFTNNNYKNNLKRVKDNKQTITLDVNNLHSLEYGMILALVYRGGV